MAKERKQITIRYIGEFPEVEVPAFTGETSRFLKDEPITFQDPVNIVIAENLIKIHNYFEEVK